MENTPDTKGAQDCARDKNNARPSCWTATLRVASRSPRSRLEHCLPATWCSITNRKARICPCPFLAFIVVHFGSLVDTLAPLVPKANIGLKERTMPEKNDHQVALERDENFNAGPVSDLPDEISKSKACR